MTHVVWIKTKFLFTRLTMSSRVTSKAMQDYATTSTLIIIINVISRFTISALVLRVAICTFRNEIITRLADAIMWIVVTHTLPTVVFIVAIFT